jgi:hypothetical protein
MHVKATYVLVVAHPNKFGTNTTKPPYKYDTANGVPVSYSYLTSTKCRKNTNRNDLQEFRELTAVPETNEITTFFSPQFRKSKIWLPVTILAPPDTFKGVSCNDLKVSEHFEAKPRQECRDAAI